MRLVVVLLGERADDLAAEALAADLREEVVEVLGGVLLVFGEDLDDVPERLALELVELLSLRGVGGLAGGPLVGRFEHADEALRRLVVVAEAPVAPRALEERQAIERRVDLVLVREHLLVLGERARVVELAVEDGLGLGHVRVGYEAALRVVAQDALEAIARLLFLALLVREKAVDVEGEVVLLEPGIVAEHPREEIARCAVVELGGGPAGVDGLLVPVLEAVDEAVARVLPLELTEAHQRLGHLAGFAGRLADELREQADGLASKLLRLRHVGIDPGVEARLELLAQRLGELRAADGRLPTRALAARSLGAPARRARRARCRGCDGSLRGRLDGVVRARASRSDRRLRRRGLGSGAVGRCHRQRRHGREGNGSRADAPRRASTDDRQDGQLTSECTGSGGTLGALIDGRSFCSPARLPGAARPFILLHRKPCRA